MQIEQGTQSLEGQIENLLEQFGNSQYERDQIISYDLNIPIEMKKNNINASSLDNQIEKLIENKDNQSLMKLLIQQHNLISENSIIKIIQSVFNQCENEDDSLALLKIGKEFKELNKQFKDFITSQAKEEFKGFFTAKHIKHALFFMTYCCSIPFTDHKLVKELKSLNIKELIFLTEILIFLFYFNNSNSKALEFINNQKIIKWFSLLLDAHFLDYCLNSDLQYLASCIKIILQQEQSLLQIGQDLENAIELQKSGVAMELMKNSKQSNNLVQLGMFYF